MKSGAENRNKLIAAVALLAIAALLLGRWVFSLTSPGVGAATVTPSTATGDPGAPQATTRRSNAKTGTAKKTPVTRLDPTLEYSLLRTSEDIKYEGNGRNIFEMQVDIPKPIAPVALDQHPMPMVPQGPPPPPPINLKFFGFASKKGEPKKVFLSEGEDVFIAAEGDIVDRRYKVLHITATSVEIEDVLNDNRQSIPLTQG